jgi:iron complex outermembrane receptor protein
MTDLVRPAHLRARPATGRWAAFALALALAGPGGRARAAHDPPAGGAPVTGELESLEFTSTAPESNAERRVGAAALTTTPRSSADDLLRLVPGLLITRHGAEGKGRQIFLRGFDAVHGADVEVTVDGVPWNEASNVHGQGYLDLGTLIPEAVAGLDAHKGAFRLEQGPFATAGSVRFELGLAPERRGARLGYEIGSSSRHRLLGSLGSADGGSFIMIEGLRDGGYGRNRDTDRLAGLGRAQLARPGGGQLIAFGGGHLARFGEPGTVPLAWERAGRVGFYDSLGAGGSSVSARGFAALRYTVTDAGGGVSTALLYGQARRLRLDENFTGYLIDAERGDRLVQRHRALGAGLRLSHERPLAERLRLLAGVDLLGDRIDQDEDRVDGDGVAFARTRELVGSQATAGARLGAVWLPTSQLRLEGGLRAQAFLFDVAGREAGGDGRLAGRSAILAWLPRLQLLAYPHPAASLLVAYGRGVRPPEARAVLVRPLPGGGVDLSAYRGGSPRPTLSHDLEAGLRFRPGERVDLGLGGFAVLVQREQIFDHLAGTNLELNATRRLGVEADATVRPAPWLSLRGDVTAVDARFSGSGRPVPGAPTLFGSLEAHAQTGWGLSGGLRFFAVGPRPLAHGARAGALSMLDTLLLYRHGPWELSLQIENLLGTRLREGEFNYASRFDRSEGRSLVPRVHYAAGPPRTIRGGIAAHF